MKTAHRTVTAGGWGDDSETPDRTGGHVYKGSDLIYYYIQMVKMLNILRIVCHKERKVHRTL